MSKTRQYLGRHLWLEIGPGIVFFLANKAWGLSLGIAALVVSTLVATGFGLWLEKRAPVFPLVGLFLVVTLGSATVYFGDGDFIKMKPTIGKLLFAAIILFGLSLRKTLLERALSGQVYLVARGWEL